MAHNHAPVVVGSPVNVQQETAHLERARSGVRQAVSDLDSHLESTRTSIRSASEHELRVLRGAGSQELSRITAAVQVTIDSALPSAISTHLTLSSEVQRLTSEVAKHVEASAGAVVARLAREEVARHQLATAIEQRVEQRVEERFRALERQVDARTTDRARGATWSGGLLGAALGALASLGTQAPLLTGAVTSLERVFGRLLPFLCETTPRRCGSLIGACTDEPPHCSPATRVLAIALLALCGVAALLLVIGVCDVSKPAAVEELQSERAAAAPQPRRLQQSPARRRSKE
jgi:hypothetical protein